VKKVHNYLICLAAGLSAAGVTIHLAAVIGGPRWYVFFGAPPTIVASARAGTWVAPVSAAGIALLMGICAAYACSALGVLGRLPLLRTMLAGIGAVCLIRGLVLIPLAVTHPELLNLFEVVAAFIWGVAGIGFVAGFVTTRSSLPDLRA
jgi:hypothetical protein